MQVLYCMTLLVLGKNHPKRHVSGLVSTHPRVIRSKPFGGIRSFYSLSALGLPTPIVTLACTCSVVFLRCYLYSRSTFIFTAFASLYC